jgi:ribosomal protein S18 acetylase RimI-like enzyme
MTDAATIWTSDVVPDIRELAPDDVSRLRLPWDGRFSQSELEQIAAARPSYSVWNRRTGEFLVGGRWRHRGEIATILEIGATGGAIDLFDAWGELCVERGVQLLVASEQAERRKREFYDRARFDLIEEIIIYELARVRPGELQIAGLQFEPFQPTDRAQFADLLALDHQAFPWLWWNCEDEFQQYAGSPGVSIDLGRDVDGRAIAYVGMTRYRSWGHLDRIAVAPDLQGRGMGRMALDYAVNALARSGAKRVGLSTQARNTRSRRLYESYGFRRAPSNDYRLYGRSIVPRVAVSSVETTE